MKKTLLVFLISLNSVVNAQVFQFNDCNPENQFTVEELAEIRKVRLAYVQTLATGNTTIIRTDDYGYTGSEEGIGDVFSISYEGTGNYYILHRPISDVQYGFIEDLTATYLAHFYGFVEFYVSQAQEEYNKNSPATASNTLSTQSQAEADALTSDERYEMRTTELESLGYNNQIQITTIKYLHRDGSHVIAITLPGTETSEFGNILKVFKAKDYGSSTLDELSVGEFNDYFNVSWNYIDNNY